MHGLCRLVKPDFLWETQKHLFMKKNFHVDFRGQHPTMPSCSEGYRLLPRRAAQVLTPEQLYLYFLLATYSDYETHRSEVLQERLVTETGYKQSTISKWIKRLEAEGLVLVTRTYGAGGIAHKKKNHYYIPAPMKDFIMVSTSLRDEMWAPLTLKEQTTVKGYLLMLKCCCLNNCNDTLYSINQLHRLVDVGRDKAQSLTRVLTELGYVAPLEHRTTGYRILGSWFDKGNAYIFPKGTSELHRTIYNDIMQWCHEQGQECPPYQKECISAIAAQYPYTHAEQKEWVHDKDLMNRYSVLAALRCRIPNSLQKIESLQYFVKVLRSQTADLASKERKCFSL